MQNDIKFSDVYYKYLDQLEIYYSDINELLKDYDFVTLNDLTIKDDYVNIDLLNESHLDNFQSNDLNETKMIFFKSDQYLSRIARSYKYDRNRMVYQYKLDFKRSKQYINQKRYLKEEKLLKKIQKYSTYECNIGGMILSLDVVLLMLCTQASFAFPFVLMNKCYNFLETTVTSGETKYHYCFSEDLLSIHLETTFNLKNIKENKIISRINIVTNIDAIFKDQKYQICKYGIMSWKILE
jgi:hypothetical protein